MNNKISIAQLQALIIIAALGFEILIMPMVISSTFELCFIIIAGFLLCLLAVNSDINIQGNKLLCFIYSVKNILVAVLLIRILTDVVKDVLLNDILIYQIIFIIVLSAGYSAWKGIEAIARISQMLFWFVVIGTIYIYLMAVPDIDLGNFAGDFYFKNIIKSCLFGFVMNTAEIIILIKSYLKRESKRAIKAVILSFLLVFAITLVIIGKIGINGMKRVEYPLFEIMYTANLPNVFIKRQEGIFIALWIISALVSVFIYFGTTVSFMEHMNIKKKSATIMLMIFTFALVLFYNGTKAVRTYCFLQILGGIITAFVIPLIYIFRRNKIE
ncbi:MAG: GerAB/ArcD/ProY family transporter [Clostridia bacterium]|nr:GerAB/ArcD/ProY family transporter [Clostridia bacterium]